MPVLAIVTSPERESPGAIPFVVDPALVALVDGYDKFSLSGLGTSMTGGSEEDFGGDHLLPFGVAALLWAAYTAVLVAAAVLTSRRDI